MGGGEERLGTDGASGRLLSDSPTPKACTHRAFVAWRFAGESVEDEMRHVQHGQQAR